MLIDVNLIVTSFYCIFSAVTIELNHGRKQWQIL